MVNLLKFLPHDFRQVKYKILQLDSIKVFFGLLRKYGRNDSSLRFNKIELKNPRIFLKYFFQKLGVEILVSNQVVNKRYGTIHILINNCVCIYIHIFVVLLDLKS